MMTSLTNQTIRTHHQLRTLRSLLTSTGPGRARWPRVRETEELQTVSRPRLRPRSYKETLK